MWGQFRRKHTQNESLTNNPRNKGKRRPDEEPSISVRPAAFASFVHHVPSSTQTYTDQQDAIPVGNTQRDFAMRTHFASTFQVAERKTK